MITNIPSVTGVPGLAVPPNWFQAPPAGSFALDDVRWFASAQRTFGSGGSSDAIFRVLQGTDGGQDYVYLSFWAYWVPALADNRDIVFLGLQNAAGTKAIVIEMRAHGAAPVPQSGPPPPPTMASGPLTGNDPKQLTTSIKVAARAAGATTWTQQPQPFPSWIQAQTRVWVQNSTDYPTADANNRWAVQIRIPLKNVTDILNDTGPNLASTFHLWYLMQGADSTGARIILGEHLAIGGSVTPTTGAQLNSGNYPNPAGWEQFTKGAGAGSFGGVTIFGNGWDDIVVKDAQGNAGTTLFNGAKNVFVARPRNYRPLNNDIPSAGLLATFRMANFGTMASNPDQIDTDTASWDYVPGNSVLVPVPNVPVISSLAASGNPPSTAPESIELVVPALTLAPGKSPHQCILVTLSGPNLNFLSASAYRNMQFTMNSRVEREAEINLEALDPVSLTTRTIRLGIEKLNLPANAPAGSDEKQFLAQTLDVLIKAGGPLAAKLKEARANLAKAGDAGSAQRLKGLLESLRTILALTQSREGRDTTVPKQVLAVFEALLAQLKRNERAANLLAVWGERISRFLLATKVDRDPKLADSVAGLADWLNAVRIDPKSASLAATLIKALRNWAPTLLHGAALEDALQSVEKFLGSARPTVTVLAACKKLLASASPAKSGGVQTGLTSWLPAAGNWTMGQERLDNFLGALSAAGVSGYEIDRIFPSVRVHVYYDTGEREGGQPVWRTQPSFGLAAYHEGALAGWDFNIEGADRIANNLYQVTVPNESRARVLLTLNGRRPEEPRVKEDPIVKPPAIEKPSRRRIVSTPKPR